MKVGKGNGGFVTGGIAVFNFMLFEAASAFLSSAGGGGMFGSGEAPSSAYASSGGPFTSGGVSFGKGLDTTTIIIIGAVVLAALYFWKK